MARIGSHIDSSVWLFLGGKWWKDVKTASTARRLIYRMDAVAAARFFSRECAAGFQQHQGWRGDHAAD